MTGHLLKMEGAGNDFLVGTGVWARLLAGEADTVARLCRRRLGVGADGALALEMVDRSRVRVVYRNADGSRARFCANGTRCAARAAVHLLSQPTKLLLETDWAVIEAEVRGDRVELALPVPEDGPEDLVLETPAGSFAASRMVVGVPHLLVRVPDLGGLDVAAVGAALAHHHELGSEGANVTFVAAAAAGPLRVRSFERGVEAETLCCGSGVVAAGLVEAAARGTDTVELVPRSGDVLRVHVTGVPPVSASVLDGPARFVAEVDPAGELLRR